MRQVVPDATWITQLRRGAVEHCVLALLSEGERYGLELTRDLAGEAMLIGGEGTIYPLLGRLRRSGLVRTTWRESNEGPPRRYYSLTEDGHAALASFRHHWPLFRNAVDSMLERGRA